MQEVQGIKPKLHVFACVNDRNDPHAMPSCGPEMTKQDIKEIKLWIREQGMTGIVFCTASGCLGLCNAEASVACSYPEGKFVKYNGKEELKQFILDEFEKQME
jgi:(2Fe-2S) ferredoxin